MIEKIADADSVFGGDREHLANAQAPVLGGLLFHALGVDLVDCQQQRLAAAQEQAGEVIIGCGQGCAPIDHHHDGFGLIQRHPGLAKDLGRNQLRVIGQDAAGIDHPRMAAGPLDLAIDPVPGDARFIAHDRAAGTGETVEESGFAHIGTADDGQNGQSMCLPPPRGGWPAPPAPASRDRVVRRRCGASAQSTAPGVCGSCPGARPRSLRRRPSQPLPRLTSARECWPRVAGAARRAAFATAARLPPLECGLGFLALVPFKGFINESSLSVFHISTRPPYRLRVHRVCPCRPPPSPPSRCLRCTTSSLPEACSRTPRCRMSSGAGS